MIMYRDIWKAFDVPVLAGVTLSVEEGELFALFGPSGTGKSVLLKTTLGLIEPDKGDVCVGGQSVFFGGEGAPARPRHGGIRLPERGLVRLADGPGQRAHGDFRRRAPPAPAQGRGGARLGGRSIW